MMITASNLFWLTVLSGANLLVIFAVAGHTIHPFAGLHSRPTSPAWGHNGRQTVTFIRSAVQRGAILRPFAAATIVTPGHGTIRLPGHKSLVVTGASRNTSIVFPVTMDTFSSFLRTEHIARNKEAKKMNTNVDRSYVSEFTDFMNHYLGQHPEVIEDQQRGWDIYWNPKVDLVALKEAEVNSVPDDEYGFAWSAWRIRPEHASQPDQLAHR